MADPKEVAFKEMQAVCALIAANHPPLSFTPTGGGPFQEPTPEYLGWQERLRWLRDRYPAQFGQLTEEEQGFAEPILMTRANWESLTKSIQIGRAPEQGK